ncbi:hypothetical protein EV424DRAFT_1644064 [Suillus variegatus]|nr:hypothetical protein EV424DRAFT_1644064 [Suillus variegatus]
MSASHASTSGTLNAGSHYRPLKLSLATISCTLAMAGSCVRACISQYRTEAANNGLSADRIKYFKAGLQWEMNTFVTPPSLQVLRFTEYRCRFFFRSPVRLYP